MSRNHETHLPHPLFIGLVALTAVSGVALWNDWVNASLGVFLFVAAGWVVSLCLHEYGHAVFAYHSGDRSVAERGYLTLNPLKYSHPLLSIVLPLVFLLLGGIGLPGGAVWVERDRIPGRLRHSLISAAGPAVNVAWALVLAGPFLFDVDLFAHLDFWSGVAFLCFLQVTASVLNLLPVPGLDGYGIIQPYLPSQYRYYLDKVAPYGMLLLFLLLFSPAVGGAFFLLVETLTNLLGVDSGFISYGFRLFRFWSAWF